MTLPHNQNCFKVENNDITFSHKVNVVSLSFDIGNFTNVLKIKHVEIVNYNPYKARGKFSIALLMIWTLKILILMM